MFQFPGFAPLARWYIFDIPGCPIRTSADQFLFADPRSFSQLITSFFASESLGIPHTLFLTSIFDKYHAYLSSFSQVSRLALLLCSCFSSRQHVNELFASLLATADLKTALLSIQLSHLATWYLVNLLISKSNLRLTPLSKNRYYHFFNLSKLIAFDWLFYFFYSLLVLFSTALSSTISLCFNPLANALVI